MILLISRPRTVNLSPSEEEIIQQYFDAFSKNGFNFEYNINNPPGLRMIMKSIPMIKSHEFGIKGNL